MMKNLSKHGKTGGLMGFQRLIQGVHVCFRIFGEKEMRMTPAAVRLSRPSADTTWLALPWWQAEPAEIQMPWAPRSVTILALG